MTHRYILVPLTLGVVIGGCNSRATPPAAAAATNSMVAEVNSGGKAASRYSLVGKWSADPQGWKTEVWEFRRDGTASVMGLVPLGVLREDDFSYKVTGDKLILSGASAKFTAPEGAGDDLKRVAEQQNKEIATYPKHPNRQLERTLVWKNADSFTLTSPKVYSGAVVTFTRRK